MDGIAEFVFQRKGIVPMRISAFAAVALVTLFSALNGSAAEPESLEGRIGGLESKLQAIEAQLGKLEFISESLQQLRNEDLRKIQRDIRGATETMKRDDASTAATPVEGDASTDSEPRVPTIRENGTDDDDAGPLVDVVKQRELLDRTATIAATVKAIEQHLSKLDDIAEQLEAVRTEDLAKLNRDLRGLKETTKKVGGSDQDGGAALPEEAPTPTAGTVIVNNETGVSHWVAINGASRLIAPGRTSFEIDYGPIRTQLTQFEGERTWPASHWRKVGDRYEITLDLRN